jgi:hypothetical protein
MGNKHNLNVLSTCSVVFLSVGGASLIIYTLMIMTKFNQGLKTNLTELELQTPWIPFLKVGLLVTGLLLTFGSWLSSLLNRTKSVPDVSINNWANGFFFFGVIVPVLVSGAGIGLYWADPVKLLENKWLTVSLLISISAGTWMLLVPDLMPKECVPD